jgi:hypothetical protein
VPNQRGRGPNPATSPPGKGGGQASQLGCRRILGAPAPMVSWPGRASLGGALMTQRGSFAWDLQGIFFETALPTSIRGGESPLSQAQTIWATTSFHTCNLFLLVVFRSLAKLVRGLDILATLGMRNTNSSNMLLSSTYHYSFAIELEYSSCVLIMAYELSYSSYVMNSAYRTLILVIHTTYMIRIRTKLRWRFVVPSDLPMSYAVDP